MVAGAKVAAEKKKEEEQRQEQKEEAPLASPKPKRGGGGDDADEGDSLTLSPESPGRMVSKVEGPLMPGLVQDARKGDKGKGKGKKGKKDKKDKRVQGHWKAARNKGTLSAVEQAAVKKEKKNLETKKKPLDQMGPKCARDSGVVKEESSSSSAPPTKRTCVGGKGSTASRAGDAEYDQEQYDKWLEALEVCDALGGSSMKVPLYQAARVLLKLDTASGEYANMATARENVLMAEKLRDQFHVLPGKERVKMLESVLAGQSGDDIPFVFKEKLLTQAVRDALSKLTSESVSTWVNMVRPGLGSGGFRLEEGCLHSGFWSLSLSSLLRAAACRGHRNRSCGAFVFSGHALTTQAKNLCSSIV